MNIKYIQQTITHAIRCPRPDALPPEDPPFVREITIPTTVPIISWRFIHGLTFHLEERKTDCPFFSDRKWYIDASKVTSLPHDFSLRYITSIEERKMEELYPNLPPEIGCKSPDLVFEAEGIVHILEYGTKKLTLPLNLTEYYKTKLAKYTPLVQTLEQLGKTVKFDILIVSKSAVVSSFEVPLVCCQYLCARYLAGYLTQDSIRRNHPDLAEYFIKSSHLITVASDMMPCFEYLKQHEIELLSKYHKKVELFPVVSTSDTGIISQAILEASSRCRPKSASTPTFGSFVEPNGRVDNTDSISRVPLVIPYVNETMDVTGGMPKLDHLPSGLAHIWFEAMQAYLNDPPSFQAFREPETDDPKVLIKTLQATPKEYKKRQHMVKISKFRPMLTELAELGVMAKSMRFSHNVVSKRRESQKHIDATTSTDDINDFINETAELITEPNFEYQSLSIELLKSAIYESKWDPCDTYKKHVDSFYVALLFISDLMRELANSAANNCRRMNFILKKMPKWDCFVLIRTTGSAKHIFFSLMINESFSFAYGNVFPKPFKSTHYNFYHFKSAQLSLIESLLTLPEKYLACKYLCTGVDQVPLFKNLLMGVLIALDNKSDAEEVVTKARYIYMKGIEFPHESRDPWRAMSGMPSRPRSRLTLFLLKRAYMLCSRVLSMQVNKLDGSVETWTNIPNFVSDETLSNWEAVLQVMYTGYFRNKNAYTSGNQSMAMLEKIVAPEMELQGDQNYHDRVIKGNSQCPTKMEWNSGFMLNCIELWQEYCAKKGIQNVKTIITNAFMKKLSNIRLTDIATLKASNIDLEEGEYIDGQKNKPREKLLLNVIKNIDVFGDSLATALPEAIKMISNRGGTMMISLFKKAQHGGLREIYVMDLASRIVQFCLEILGRLICETFDYEAMTHVSKKTTYRSEHIKKAEGIAASLEKKHPGMQLHCYTTYDNADAEKWNQYHHVNKFAFMLVNMTDEILHPFIRIGLSQWLNKRIRMEDTLLHSMATGLYTPSSTTAKHIVEGFRGITPSVIAPTHMKDLHVESGMMQGLLHFVSSALHSLALLGFTRLCESYMSRTEAMLKQQHGDVVFRPVITNVVTSDDSISAISIITNLEDAKVLQMGNVTCSAIKDIASRYFGIITSAKKSSLCTAPISEFNSQWMDRRQLIRPKMRHILACFTIESIGNFVEMQDNLCSLRQQALESGVSIHHVSFINFLQGLSFYRCAGSSTTSIFSYLFPYLKKLQDPNMGFFLMDPPMLSGMVSIDYNVYNTAMHNPNLAARYFLASKNIDTLAGCSGSLRVATSMAIEFTNVKRFKSLLSKVNTEEIRNFVNANPDILYRKPRTLEEVKVCLYLKMMQPNVLRSISKDYNVLARELASSVYLFWAPIVRPNKDIMDLVVGKSVEDSPKLSIAEMMIQLDAEITRLTKTPQVLMTDFVKNLFFPLHEEYDRLSVINDDLEARLAMPSEVLPKTACTVQIFEGIRGEVSLPKLCAHRWFKLQEVYTSDAVMDIYWKEAKDDYIFLRDTHDETLIASGLDSATHLRMMLERVAKRGKFITPASRGGRSVKSAGLATYVSYNFQENVVMRIPTRTTSKDDETVKRLRHISMILQLPFNDTVKEKLALDEINRASYHNLKAHPRFSPLALVHKSCPKDLTYDRVLSFCSRTTATIGSWTVIQQHSHQSGKWKWQGYGVWCGTLFSEGRHTTVSLEVYNNYIKTIHTTDVDELIRQQARFVKLLTALKLRPSIRFDSAAAAYYHDDFAKSAGTPVILQPAINPLEVMVGGDRPRLEIKDKLLSIKYQNTTIYHFSTRPDMIESSPTLSRNPLLYVLNNYPMPFGMAKDFIIEDHTDIKEMELKNWFVSILQSSVPQPPEPDIIYVAGELQDPSFEAAINEMLQSDFLMSRIKQFQGELPAMSEMDFGEMIMALTTDDIEERIRVFEADIEASHTISSVHFKFLDNLINEFAPTLYRIARDSKAYSREDALLYKAFTGYDVPIMGHHSGIFEFDEDEDGPNLEESFSESAKTKSEHHQSP